MRSANFKLTHVAQIENSRGRADRKMLLDNPAVTDGHLETTENRHPCAEFLVKVKQDSALGHIHQRINFNKPDQRERDGLASSANSSSRYPQQTFAVGGKRIPNRRLARRTIIFAGSC